jgi:hypothetical protein
MAFCPNGRLFGSHREMRSEVTTTVAAPRQRPHRCKVTLLATRPHLKGEFRAFLTGHTSVMQLAINRAKLEIKTDKRR